MKTNKAGKKRVLFICGGKACSEKHDAGELKTWFKSKIKEAGLKEQVRACVVSCLDYCDSAPNCVLYPDEKWYSFTDRDDREEIFKDLVKGL